MHNYRFEVLDKYRIVSSEMATLPTLKAAWRNVARLAGEAAEETFRIRVTDENGGIVILTGVASARRVTASLRAA